MVSAILLIYSLVRMDAYYIFLSAASAAIIFVPQIFYAVFRLQPIPSLTFSSRIFIFLAFHIGMAAKGYIFIPYYDKAVHLLSGVFFAFVGMIVFYGIKHNRTIETHDFPLCMVFSFCFSLMTAAVWEIYEYVISHILGTDPQGVLATGVGDTMQDIISCLIGTVAFCVLVRQYFRSKKKNILLSAVETYVTQNFAQKR